MIRYYISPVLSTVGLGWHAKAAEYPHIRTAMIWRHGQPWALVRVEADDFTLIDSDPDCRSVFENFFDVFNTRQDLIDGLRIRTVADIPVARRAALRARLASLGIDVSDFSTSTPLMAIMRRLHEFHQPGDVERL